MRTRHLAFFLHLALQAEAALRGPEMVPWLRRLDADVDNLRAALEWSFEADPDAALRLTVAMMGYWRSRSYGFEAVERFGQAAELALRLHPVSPSSARDEMILVSRVLAAAGYASALWADARGGHAWAEQAVALARRAEDGEALTDALGALGMTSVFSGQREGLRDVLGELIEVAESRGDWWTLSMIQTSAAYSAVGVGDIAAADALAPQGDRGRRSFGEPLCHRLRRRSSWRGERYQRSDGRGARVAGQGDRRMGGDG